MNASSPINSTLCLLINFEEDNERGFKGSNKYSLVMLKSESTIIRPLSSDVIQYSSFKSLWWIETGLDFNLICLKLNSLGLKILTPFIDNAAIYPSFKSWILNISESNNPLSFEIFAENWYWSWLVIKFKPSSVPIHSLPEIS